MSGPVDVLNKAATYAAHATIAAERILQGKVADMDDVRQAFLRIASGLSGAAEASDAVAELIEAAKPMAAAASDRGLMADVLQGMRTHEAETMGASIFRIAAALANVGGAA